jgi:L-lactate dehydrogenase (cytochrome)
VLTESCLQDEMEMNMRLIGASKISDLNPSMVDARGLIGHGHVQTVPSDTLGLTVYDTLSGPKEQVIASEKGVKAKL